MSTLKSLKCLGCGTDAEFAITIPQGDDGVNLNAAGDVVWTNILQNPPQTLDDVVKIFQDADPVKDEYFHVLFSCPKCKDECCAVAEFEDGSATENEEEALKKAFPTLFGLPVTPDAPEGKVSTADCVRAVVGFLSVCGWASDDQKAAKNWKRRSKKGSAEHCVRVFENKKDPSIIFTVVSSGDRIQGLAWDKDQTLKDAQVEAVMAATGASKEDVEELAQELEKDYEPCGNCGVMLKKGIMATCEKCGQLACKRCLLDEGFEMRDEDVDVFGQPAGSKLKWCAKCLGETECAYVDSVPYDELPLLMSHQWHASSVESHILNRLKGGK